MTLIYGYIRCNNVSFISNIGITTRHADSISYVLCPNDNRFRAFIPSILSNFRPFRSKAAIQSHSDFTKNKTIKSNGRRTGKCLNNIWPVNNMSRSTHGLRC